jgi:Zn-dependent alcohol dehydrogenase
VEQFIKVDFKGHTTMVQQMTLYMMTERVDPAQMVKLAATVETGHKAVQEALKVAKQLSETVDKLKAEAATTKRKVDDVTNQLETLKKKVNKA